MFLVLIILKIGKASISTNRELAKRITVWVWLWHAMQPLKSSKTIYMLMLKACQGVTTGKKNQTTEFLLLDSICIFTKIKIKTMYIDYFCNLLWICIPKYKVGMWGGWGLDVWVCVDTHVGSYVFVFVCVHMWMCMCTHGHLYNYTHKESSLLGHTPKLLSKGYHYKKRGSCEIKDKIYFIYF